MSNEQKTVETLHEEWHTMPEEERMSVFKKLNQADAEEFILELHIRDVTDIIMALPVKERRIWMRFLPPDDVTDIIQEVEPEHKRELLDLIDEPTRKEVNALLAYREDSAGGLMDPRYARLRPEMTVDEAVTYFRNQLQANSNSFATINYSYVLDDQQHLLGVLSLKTLFSSPGHKKVSEIMRTEVITVKEYQDQESLSYLTALHNLTVIPVVDDENHMKGIVTNEDIIDVFREEATEDIHKMGGLEALDEPYVGMPFANMYTKRARWLSLLFIGELFTSTAMAIFETEISKAVVLALFVPLIISSGGNSGSQASTLIIRAMSLREITLKNWFYVARKEILMGLTLGVLLGCIGFTRIVLWEFLFHIYGGHYLLLAVAIFCSLIGVVAWGTLTGSMLPFILRKIGLDPAISSAPLVATIVDVSGLIIYFTTAKFFLTGTLL